MIHLCGVGVGECREKCHLFLLTINSLYYDSNHSLNSQPGNVHDSCSVSLQFHDSVICIINCYTCYLLQFLTAKPSCGFPKLVDKQIAAVLERGVKALFLKALLLVQ